VPALRHRSRRAREAGFAELLTKPLKFQDLEAALSRYF
jgi:hypothetical protein